MIASQDAPVNGRENPSDRTETESDRDAILEEIRAMRREMERLRSEVTDPDVPEFLTVGQVVEQLSLSERSVRSYISDGDLPSVTFGRARRIPVDGLQSFISDRLDDD